MAPCVCFINTFPCFKGGLLQSARLIKGRSQYKAVPCRYCLSPLFSSLLPSRRRIVTTMRLFAILAFLFALRTHAILVPQPISRECDADDGSLVFQSVSGAASTQACDDSTGVCVAFSIPVTSDTTAENADILAAIKAPASLGWVAFGFGQQMTGSLVYV